MYEDVGSWHAEFLGRHETNVANAQMTGQNDGLMGLPEARQEAAHPSEDKIKAGYAVELHTLQGDFSGFIEILYQEYVNLKAKLLRSEAVKTKEIDELLGEIGHRYEEKEKQSRDTYKNARRRMQDKIENGITKPLLIAKNEQQQVCNKVGRQSLNVTWTNTPLYFLLLLIVGASEVPLNVIAGRILRMNDFETYMIAATLAIGVPLAAHFGGIAWKRIGESSENKWIFGGATFLVLGLSVILSFMRLGYFVEVGEPNTTAAVLTGIIGALLYFVALVMAHSSHDSSADMERVFAVAKKEKEQYDLEHPIAAKELEAFAVTHNDQLEAMKNEEITAKQEVRQQEAEDRKELSTIMGNYDAKLSQLQAQEKQIESSFQLSLAEYRKANVIARPNHKLPTCFERTHTITDHYHFAKKAELEINPQITSMLEDA